jgi:hypothetical protein
VKSELAANRDEYLLNLKNARETALAEKRGLVVKLEHATALYESFKTEASM